jgi:PAS domain S-box-containing protein
MPTAKDYARDAAARLTAIMRLKADQFDNDAVIAVIERTVKKALSEHSSKADRKVREAEAAAQRRLMRMLTASPAVVYSFRARDDFGPTFVSDNLESVFGYRPGDYLDDPSFWRDRVHPDDLARVEAEIARFFENGIHAVEYRFRKEDGSYCWVNDEQRLIRDEDGKPLEVVGSWSDITARKQLGETLVAAQDRIVRLLASAPAVIYSFKASGDFAPSFVSRNIED